MDDLPLDFTRYLGQRLGLDSEQAADLLGAWLKDYEPVSCRPAGVSRRGQRSGDSLVLEGAQQTG